MSQNQVCSEIVQNCETEDKQRKAQSQRQQANVEIEDLEKKIDEDNIQNHNKDNSQNLFKEFQGFKENQNAEKDSSQEDAKDQEEGPSLKRVRSSEQLLVDFKQNQKILTSLSTNIDDLFKKISSLTQQVNTQILPDLGSTKRISSISQKKQEVEQKIQEKKEQSPKPSDKDIITQPSQQSIESGLNFNLNNFDTFEEAISMKHFQTGKSLGHGKFGEVIQCRHNETGYLMALKKIFKSTIQKYQMKDQLLIELECCKRMNHPNIVKSYYSFTDEFHIFLLMECANGQKLTKKFKSSEGQVKKIIKQVVTSIKYMHENGVIHRDLKPENIIISESGMIKICDFGWSHTSDAEDSMNIICGTLDYVCPEMVKGQEYTKQVDIWSVGVLTYELLFGIAPFKGQNKKATFEKVKNIQLSFPEDIQVSQEAIDFMKGILKVESERMRIEQILQHKFLKLQQEKEEQQLGGEIDNLLI